MIKGIVLDLDGTLTAPELIDFGAMRRAIGCPEGETILEFLANLELEDANASQQAHAAVFRMEREAALRVRPAENLERFIRWLEARSMPRAIFTRNSRESTLLTLELLRLAGRFDPIIAREDAPPKPAPDGIFRIAAQWGVPASDLMMVGDFRHDIEAGARAGAHTVLYTAGRVVDRFLMPVAAQHVVYDLMELPDLMERLGT